MAGRHSTALNSKLDSILSQERSLADSIARALRKKRPISVWEIMMPILLIFNFAKSKTEREVFVQNYLFTKKLALEAAREMVESGRSKKAAMVPAEEKTNELLATVKDGIYTEEIRRKQLREIDLLIDHYCLLLAAEGEDYPALVTAAYRTRTRFLDFLARLEEAERAVNSTALEALGERGDPGFVAKMEEAAATLRAASADRIFGRPD